MRKKKGGASQKKTFGKREAVAACILRASPTCICPASDLCERSLVRRDEDVVQKLNEGRRKRSSPVICFQEDFDETEG